MSLLGGRPRGFALRIIFVIIGVVECLSHSVPTSANRDAREPERDARGKTRRDSAFCFYEPIACCQSADCAARARAPDDGKWGRAQHGKALKLPHGSWGIGSWLSASRHHVRRPIQSGNGHYCLRLDRVRQGVRVDAARRRGDLGRRSGAYALKSSVSGAAGTGAIPRCP
jgi:hypothetical protein